MLTAMLTRVFRWFPGRGNIPHWSSSVPWRRAAVLGLTVLVLTPGGSNGAPSHPAAAVSSLLLAARPDAPTTPPTTPSPVVSASTPAPAVTAGNGPAGSLRTTGSAAVAL